MMAIRMCYSSAPRRTRALFLGALAAIESAPAVARFMAKELGRDEARGKSSIEYFLEIAESYRSQL